MRRAPPDPGRGRPARRPPQAGRGGDRRPRAECGRQPRRVQPGSFRGRERDSPGQTPRRSGGRRPGRRRVSLGRRRGKLPPSAPGRVRRRQRPGRARGRAVPQIRPTRRPGRRPGPAHPVFHKKFRIGNTECGMANPNPPRTRRPPGSWESCFNPAFRIPHSAFLTRPGRRGVVPAPRPGGRLHQYVQRRLDGLAGPPVVPAVRTRTSPVRRRQPGPAHGPGRGTARRVRSGPARRPVGDRVRAGRLVGNRSGRGRG